MIRHKKLISMLVMMLACLTTTRAVNCFTIQDKEGQRTKMAVDRTFSETTIINPFTEKSPISGLCITGSISKESDDYLVRVILKTADGHEYCVLESYDEIHDETSFDFSDYCEETALLESVIPESVKLVVVNATLSIESISQFTVSERMQQSKTLTTDRENVRRAQVNCNIDKINEYNRNHNKIWIAGPTRLAAMTYEERMRMLGCPDDVSTGGYEYYYDGFFQVGNFSNGNSLPRYNSPYVSSFDWRNRHGKSWVTPVKDQGNSSYCFAFTCAAAVESMYMLYYNDATNISLSIQELACCTGQGDSVYYKGGDPRTVFPYLKDFGVRDSASYPFVDLPMQQCWSNEYTANETVKIGGYDSLQNSQYADDSIKKWIINYGPLTSGYYYYNDTNTRMGHSMLLVGYDTIRHEDIIRIFYDNGLQPPSNVDNYIGRTYWIYKNSRGENEDIGGYQQIIFEEVTGYGHNHFMRRSYRIIGPITSTLKSVQDVICEDADGDGYYYWGIGPKPAHCPSWAPDTPDGDDSNYDYGPMNTYGHLLNLHSLISQSVIITGNTTYSYPHYNYGVTIITPNSSLTITDQLTLYEDVYIVVANASTLIVDGGHINNADIRLQSGGKLILCNGGTITMAEGKEFSAPIGSIVEMSEGSIN